MIRSSAGAKCTRSVYSLAWSGSWIMDIRYLFIVDTQNISAWNESDNVSTPIINRFRINRQPSSTPLPHPNMSGFVNYGDLITLTTMCGEKEGHLNADGVIDNSLRILVMEKKISIPAKFRDCSKRNHKQFEFNKTNNPTKTINILLFLLLISFLYPLLSNPTTTYIRSYKF